MMELRILMPLLSIFLLFSSAKADSVYNIFDKKAVVSF